MCGHSCINMVLACKRLEATEDGNSESLVDAIWEIK